MFKLLLQLLALYVLYKLIFSFIIPVYRTTKQMKAKMNDMHEHIRQQQNQQQNQAPPRQEERKTVPSDDYIEFEEVK